MSKTLFIRKPRASFEAELMDSDTHSEQVTSQATEAQAIVNDTEAQINDVEETVGSLESRIESLEVIASFANTPMHSFEQAQLTTALAYTAVQGTDLDMHRDVFGKTPRQFNDSFESEGALTFSSEAIGQTIKDIASATVEKLKQAGRWLLELATKIINVFKSKEGRIKNLKALIQKAKEKSELSGTPTIRLTGSQANNIGSVEDFIKLTSMLESLQQDGGVYKETLDSAEKLLEDYAKLDLYKNYSKAVEKLGLFYGDTFEIKFSENPDKDNVIGKTEFIGRKQLEFRQSEILKAPPQEDSDMVDHFIKTFSMAVVTEAKDKDKDLEVKVFSVDELSKVADALEKAVSGKLYDLTNIKKITAHALFKIPSMGQTEFVADLRKVMMSVNRILVQPQGMFMSAYQSVSDDYLRFAERSAKAHISGKVEAKNEIVPA